MFGRRNEPDRFGNPGLQDRYVQTLAQVGAQIRIFGDTGVGKTSLAIFGCREIGAKPLLVQCRSTQNFGEIIEQAVRSIQGLRLKSYRTRREATATMSAEGGWRWLASLRGELSAGGATEQEFEVVDRHLVDLLYDLMLEQGYSVLILDNFHNVTDPDTRMAIAQTMEVLSDRATYDAGITMVLIGVAQEADALLATSPSVRRRTVDIGVPRMPDAEIEGILQRGFRLLELRISDALTEHLAYFSDGFPYYAHLLGLNTSRVAITEQVKVVTKNHAGAALLRTVNEVHETYSGLVRDVVTGAGRDGYGDQPRGASPIESNPADHAEPALLTALRLIANSRDRSWSAWDLGELWRLDGTAAAPSKDSIERIMSMLASATDLPILVPTGLGSPPKFRFSNPQFRTYLRIATVTGLIGMDEETDTRDPFHQDWSSVHAPVEVRSVGQLSQRYATPPNLPSGEG